MAPIRKRHSRRLELGTTAGVKAMALPTVAVRRVLEQLVAYGLATRPRARRSGKSRLATPLLLAKARR